MAKKEVKKSKEKASEKGKKDLSPLEKARLARASGKGGKTKKKAKKPALVFKAPEEFKPFFARVMVALAKDGILTDMRATRIKGSPTNENAKTIDMALFDPETLRRMAMRFAGPTFIRNEAKRLPGNSAAMMLMRVSANRETGAIKVSMKDVKFKEGKDGKAKLLDKKDVKYRALRKAAKFMAPAFTKVLPFPSAADIKAKLKEAEA